MTLAHIRSEKHLTQKSVSAAVGLSRGAYANIESGRRRPSPEVAQRIGLILGFDWTVFYHKGNMPLDEKKECDMQEDAL